MRHAPLSSALVLALALTLVGSGGTLVAEEPTPRSWRWLDAAAPPTNGVWASPLLEPEERARGEAVSKSVLSLVFTSEWGRPEDAAVVGAGVVIRSDGVVAVSWQVLSRVSRSCWLWGRTHGGEWVRVIPMGSTWWGDVGLGRLVTVRRRWPAVVRGEISKKDLRRRYVAVGSARGRAPVISVGRLEALVLYDPDEERGRRVLDRRWKKGASDRAAVIALAFEDSLATQGSSGTPVFDVDTGRCVGLVTAVGSRTGRTAHVRVRPWSYLEPFLENIRREILFDPPDLGVRWGPAPVTHGEPPPLPEALVQSHEVLPGGLLVATVDPKGPANRILWEGDIVLEIEGRPVFGEVYESRALALMSLFPGVPADLVVLRGGERRPVQVMTRRARDLYPDFDAEHARRAGHLPRAPGGP